jgi:hypothetical protein
MRRVAIVLVVLAAGCVCGFVLNPSLDITQYAHTPRIIRDGSSRTTTAMSIRIDCSGTAMEASGSEQ